MMVHDHKEKREGSFWEKIDYIISEHSLNMYFVSFNQANVYFFSGLPVDLENLENLEKP